MYGGLTEIIIFAMVFLIVKGFETIKDKRPISEILFFMVPAIALAFLAVFVVYLQRDYILAAKDRREECLKITTAPQDTPKMVVDECLETRIREIRMIDGDQIPKATAIKYLESVRLYLKGIKHPPPM